MYCCKANPDIKIALCSQELILIYFVKKTKLNFVALVRKRTMPTERLPLVSEISAKFCG
jgi:hypothetical protein